MKFLRWFVIVLLMAAPLQAAEQLFDLTEVVPGVYAAIARDQYEVNCNAAVILLDDGFQYRQLGRACDIVLVPTAGLGNRALIPAGPMREPAAALARADLVVRTGPDPLATLATDQRQWRWQARIIRLQDAMGTGAPAPRHVSAVSAIARPTRFHDDLARYGCTVDAARAFPDHHRYTGRDVAMLLALAAPVVTTAKDAVKLAPLWPASRPLWIARQQAEAEDGLLAAILQRLPGP